MRAIVLVGGEGTRMRPLTRTIPKPLLPLVDRPFLQRLLEHLGRHGVEHVTLSSPYLEEAFASFLRAWSTRPEIDWVTEAEPLGTGGAVANAARALGETFLVGNGDILTDLDVTGLVGAHRGAGAVATIALTPVQDARPFGLVELDNERRVLAFREKPAELVPGLVNAGTYVLEPEAMRGVVPGRATSIEREVFPALIATHRTVLGYPSDVYWIDVGTPEKYLQATFDVLRGRIEGLSYARPHVDPSAEVEAGAKLGPLVVVGPGARVASGATVEDAVLMEGSSVESGATVRGSILGPWAIVGARALLQGAVLADRSRVATGVTAMEARVEPGETLPS